MKKLHIFRAGVHTSSDGRELTFSDADLQGIVASYDPTLHEAPIVVGHPKADSPAYGHAASLSFADGDLFAEPIQVDDAFAALVQAGRYKKVSASFYEPDSPQNPKPGTYYLRHIGFLGAQPPALKGLKAIEFNAADEGVVEFSDGYWRERLTVRVFRRLRDFIIDRFGKDEADAVLPEYELEELAATAERERDVLEPTFNESTKPPEKAPTMSKTQAELDAEKAQRDQQTVDFAERAKTLDTREAAIAAAEAKGARREHAEFADGLVREGKLLPAHRDGLVEFMAGLPADGVVEFGEGAAAVKKPHAEWLRGFLADIKPFVDYNERGQPDGNLPDDTSADDISDRALEFQEAESKKGRVVSIADAVTHVTRKGASRS